MRNFARLPRFISIPTRVQRATAQLQDLLKAFLIAGGPANSSFEI
jgi:hypothetical protein